MLIKDGLIADAGVEADTTGDVRIEYPSISIPVSGIICLCKAVSSDSRDLCHISCWWATTSASMRSSGLSFQHASNVSQIRAKCSDPEVGRYAGGIPFRIS